MVTSLYKIYREHEEGINYLFFGFLTTIVNLSTKWGLLYTLLDPKDDFQLQIAILASWVTAVIFSYITNRKFVFKSKNVRFLKEFSTFVGSRVATLFLEMALMWLFISFFHLNSNLWVMISTIITQFIIVVTNYFLSKLFIFKTK